MLRHWEETIHIIRKESSEKYEFDYKDYPFIAKDYLIFHYLKIIEETFNGWVEVVKHVFIKET